MSKSKHSSSERFQRSWPPRIDPNRNSAAAPGILDFPGVSDTVGDSLEYGVRTAYTVIEDYMKRGYHAASQIQQGSAVGETMFNQYPYYYASAPNPWANMMQSMTSGMTPYMLPYMNEMMPPWMMRMWMSAWQGMAPPPWMMQPPANPDAPNGVGQFSYGWPDGGGEHPSSAQDIQEFAQAQGWNEDFFGDDPSPDFDDDPAFADLPSSEAPHRDVSAEQISLRISSMHPIDVIPNLAHGADTASLTIDPLHSADSNAAPIGTVTISRLHDAEGSNGLLVGVTIPPEQLPGRYSGAVRNAKGDIVGGLTVVVHPPTADA